MVYIRRASCISIQDTFSIHEGVCLLQAATFPATVIEPEYKKLINPALLRRMSPIVRYGVATALDCLASAGITSPDAIITGTGLGGLHDTQKFLDTIIRSESDTLPPTAFIQSTHNTIAGQIALQTQCRGYNMTYVQNGLSFEYALQDACWLLEEGTKNVLVGGSDEKIDFLKLAADRLNIPESESNKISEGAASFLLSQNRENALARITGIAFTTSANIVRMEFIQQFLAAHALTVSNIDCLLYAINSFGKPDMIAAEWKGPRLSFPDYCGYFHTNSAFGVFLAVQLIAGKIKLTGLPDKPNTMLVLNSYGDKSLGLTLIQQP